MDDTDGILCYKHMPYKLVTSYGWEYNTNRKEILLSFNIIFWTLKSQGIVGQKINTVSLPLSLNTILCCKSLICFSRERISEGLQSL